MLVAQQVIHDLEPVLALRVVDAADILAAFELALGVVAEEGKDGDDAGRANVQGEFILENGELLDVFREALDEIRAIVVQRRCRLRVLCDSWVWRCLLGEGRGRC